MISFPSFFPSSLSYRGGRDEIVLNRKKGKQCFHDDADDDEKKGKRVEFVFTKKAHRKK